MKAVINDISFEYKFNSKTEAIVAFHQWLDVCKELTRDRVRRVQDIYGNWIDTQMEIAPNYKIIQLVQEFKDREDRSRLLSFLAQSTSYEENEMVYVEGKLSKAAALAYREGILISLISKENFMEETILGQYKNEEIKVDNLSKLEHVNYHSEKLGIRFYEPNKKHGKKTYVRAGGLISSEMDLDDGVAQEVLDGAVEIDGHLFAYYADCFYEFRRTEKNTYHGFKNEALSKDLERKILDKLNT